MRLFIIFLSVFLLMGLIFMCVGFAVWIEYDEMADRVVTVSAEITKIVEIEKTDSDGETYTDRDVYLEYEYNGKVYSDVKHNTYESSYRVGKVIKIEIDSTDPTRLRPSLGLGLGFSLVGSVITTVFALMIHNASYKGLAENKKRKLWKTHYADRVLNAEIVKEDVDFELEQKKKYSTVVLIILALGLAAVTAGHSLILGASWMPAATALILAAVIFNYLKGRSKINEKLNGGLLSIKRDTLVKTEVSDSEGTKEILSFGKLSAPVDSSVYVSFMQERLSVYNAGSEVFAAVNDDNEVLRIFNTDEFRMF